MKIKKFKEQQEKVLRLQVDIDTQIVCQRVLADRTVKRYWEANTNSYNVSRGRPRLTRTIGQARRYPKRRSEPLKSSHPIDTSTVHSPFGTLCVDNAQI